MTKSRFAPPSMSTADIMRKQLGQKVEPPGEPPLMVASMKKVLSEEPIPSEETASGFSLVAKMREQLAKEAAQ